MNNNELGYLIESLIKLESLIVFMILILIGHLVIQGVWFLFSPGQVFNRVGRLFIVKSGTKVNENGDIEPDFALHWTSKPLFSCPQCMSSFWGSVVFWGGWYLGVHSFTWEFHIPFMLSLLGWVSLYEERNQ